VSARGSMSHLFVLGPGWVEAGIASAVSDARPHLRHGGTSGSWSPRCSRHGFGVRPTLFIVVAGLLLAQPWVIFSPLRTLRVIPAIRPQSGERPA